MICLINSPLLFVNISLKLISRSIVKDLVLRPLKILIFLLDLLLSPSLIPQVILVLLTLLKSFHLLLSQRLLLFLVILTALLGYSADPWFFDAPILERVVYDECQQYQDKVMNPIVEDPKRELNQLDPFPIAGSDVYAQFGDGQSRGLGPAKGEREQLIRLVVGERDFSKQSEKDVEEDELHEFDCQVHFKLMFIDIFNSSIQRAKSKATTHDSCIQICVLCCIIKQCKNSCKKNPSFDPSYLLDPSFSHLQALSHIVAPSLIKQYYIYCSSNMDTNYSFSGMTLTQIFEIQPLQSLFIKFWYLGLTSQLIISPQDANIFKAIRKNVTFANCFTFQMPIRTYINYIDKILQALATIDPKKTFQILLGHLRNNKVLSVSFQLFGVAFLQLFGRILELLNTQMMNKILRKIFYEITVINKMGVSTLKVKGIRSISFEELIPNFNDLLEEKASNNQLGTGSKLNPQQVSLHHGQRNRSTTERQYDIKTIKGRLQAQRDHNYQLRQSQGEHYPIGDRIRNKQRASISCYMMGGFQIVDYSDSINQLHKKLLTKILLNK